MNGYKIAVKTGLGLTLVKTIHRCPKKKPVVKKKAAPSAELELEFLEMQSGRREALEHAPFDKQFKRPRGYNNKWVTAEEVEAQRTSMHAALDAAMLDTATGMNVCRLSKCDKDRFRQLHEHMKRHVKACSAGIATQRLGSMI